MRLSKFPYKDTLKPILKLKNSDTPYASNLLCAVILERCMKDHLSRIGVNRKLKFNRCKEVCNENNTDAISTFIDKNKIPLGEIVNKIEELIPYSKIDSKSFVCLIRLRNAYMHSKERTQAKLKDPKKRSDQYRKDNEYFRSLIAWVIKNRYY